VSIAASSHHRANRLERDRIERPSGCLRVGHPTSDSVFKGPRRRAPRTPCNAFGFRHLSVCPDVAPRLLPLLSWSLSLNHNAKLPREPYRSSGAAGMLSRRHLLTRLSAAAALTLLGPRTSAAGDAIDSAGVTPHERCLIVNADDFGGDEGSNRGVVVAHERGIVTSASLMVNMPGAQSAVRLARECPNLSLGLHANFTAGSRVIDLSDLRALRQELERQCTMFTDMVGEIPTHIDSHHHVHRKFNIAPLFIELCRHHRIPLRGFSRSYISATSTGSGNIATRIFATSAPITCSLSSGTSHLASQNSDVIQGIRMFISTQSMTGSAGSSSNPSPIRA
jgi:hypothetical protein